MLEELAGHLRDHSGLPEGIVVYKVLDTLTDSFFAVLDTIDDTIEELEGAVLDRPRRAQLTKLVEVKNTLVPMRKIATRQRNVIGRAEDEIAGLPGLDAGPHDFRDISQRMVSVSELIDSSRDVLTGAQDVYLSSVTERLTLVATIFFPLTVLTGFFGMNFGWMVQHIDSFTSFAIFGVGGMVALTTVVLVLFCGPAISDRGGAATIEGHKSRGRLVSTWSFRGGSRKPRSPVGLVKQPGKHVCADSHEYALAA
jgi:Mg2+ and Co2+ transporter CorA